MRKSEALIIGAGPFGLALAARASARGASCVTVGRPLSFWKQHMPKGMFLRSGYDWHLDPQDEFTFERFVREEGVARTLPIPLHRFVAYGEWFERKAGIDVTEARVTRVSRPPSSTSAATTFIVELDSGESIEAAAVLCAPGFWPFGNLPRDLVSQLDPRHARHSADFSDPARFAGRRCLIVGGRQSAFETAALLRENGAADVTIVHRHPSPRFAESDWSWVAGDLQAAQATPGWFANLSADRRKAIERRFWEEGRLKLEPWLGSRLRQLDVTVAQNTVVERIARASGGSYRATLRGEAEQTVDFDEAIFATGFKMDAMQIDYLQPLLPHLAMADGWPDLNAGFESKSIPELFFVGLVAARQFGPYMGFTASCPLAGRVAMDAALAEARQQRSR